MRALDEEDVFFEALSESLASQGLVLRRFEAAAQPLRDSIRLFARARGVVGVHGGALANVVFCQSGSTVVELGFRTPQTWHYAHVASALGLDYHLFPLEVDERGAGGNLVRVPPGTPSRVASAFTEQVGRDEL